MESAIFGLLGVALGGILTIFKEWWWQRSKNRKDAEYLSIQVSCELERYAAHCAEVVADGGLCDGQYDNGCRIPQVKPPQFEPKAFDVEWKSLPAGLMYEILDLPYKAELANESIRIAFEDDSPPDFSEGFEERQVRYASLGIAASGLATKLRKHVGLSTRNIGDWDYVAYMEDSKAEIELRRKERVRRLAADP